ncbi:hypothetical protein IC793_00900 [Acinetobacter seifertii]|nr:hypothetical protein [Acinetobacter seifertii]QNX16010.1 hypothetical protein IC793_00900 [Acinetobacter seifertii]
MTEIMNCLSVLALFAVFGIGLVTCCTEAKKAWSARKITGQTVFKRKAYSLKAGSSLCLAALALIGLFDAAKGVFW